MIKYKKDNSAIAFPIDYISCDICEKKFKDELEIKKFNYVTMQFVNESFDVDCCEECAKTIKSRSKSNGEKR